MAPNPQTQVRASWFCVLSYGGGAAPVLTTHTQLDDRSHDTKTLNNGPLHTCKTISGMAAIYHFGDTSVQLPSAWEWRWKKGANTASDIVFQLRPGMRGRHVFGQRSRPELAGCCFEWRVIPDALSKLPKFELSQVELTDHGLRAHTRKVTASTGCTLESDVC